VHASDSLAAETLDFTDTVDLASSAGTTITVWEGYFATTREVWASVYDPINQVAVDSANQATVVWCQWNNAVQQWDIYFSTYE